MAMLRQGPAELCGETAADPHSAPPTGLRSHSSRDSLRIKVSRSRGDSKSKPGASML